MFAMEKKRNALEATEASMLEFEKKRDDNHIKKLETFDPWIVGLWPWRTRRTKSQE